MIQSEEQAVEEMSTMLLEAWDASPLTTLIPIVWGDVVQNRQGVPDPLKNPSSFIHVQVLHEDARKVSLRGPAGSRFQQVGTIAAFLYVAGRKGGIHARPLISVAASAFQGKASPNGVWFRNTRTPDMGPQGTWYVVAMTTTFLYDLIR